MAIISASEFKASREAIEAGVHAVSDSDAESAIRKAEAKMNVALGYAVATDATTVSAISGPDELLTLPQRARTVSAVSETSTTGVVSTVTGAVLRSNGFRLYRSGGWYPDHRVTVTGTFGYASTDDQYILAKEFVTLATVRYLQSTGPTNGMPSPVGGAYLSGYSAEGADFQFFTPDGATTGYGDLEKLLDLIGRHPDKGKGLYTVSTGRSGVEFDPERLWHEA